MSNNNSKGIITPKELFKEYINSEGWSDLTYKNLSFIVTFSFLILIIILILLNNYYSADIIKIFIQFFDSFYLTGFIAGITILTLIITGFAIIGSIMQKEFIYALQTTRVIKVIYFVIFWDALWAGISSFIWILYAFFKNFNISNISILFGVIGIITLIYIIFLTISLLITIARLFELKGDYVKSIIKLINKDE